MSSGRQNKFWIGICPRIEPRVWHSPRVWAFLESSQKPINELLNLFTRIHPP